MGTGMNSPDDLLYVPSDGSILVGEHGDGHLSRITAPGVLARLPQVIPLAEGLAQIGDTLYVADQLHNRIVKLTATGVATVLQLTPDPSGNNLDGISSDLKGSGLVIPDSPHGTVLFVDAAGHITGRVGGFSRPAGVFPDPQYAGYLVADENASAVYEIVGGRPKRLAGGLSGVDDAVREQNGHVIAILPAAGRLVDVTTGVNIATKLNNPQGLGFDGAGNLLVAESGSGRVDMVVRTFTVEVPAPAVQLVPGQAVCLGILRAPGYTDGVAIQESIGATYDPAPSTADRIEVVPGPCGTPPCTVNIAFRSPSGQADAPQYVAFTYRD